MLGVQKEAEIMSKIHIRTAWHTTCSRKNNQKRVNMTNIIKNRNAAPAAFGSVLDQLFPKTVSTLLNDSFWGLGNPNESHVAPVNILETAESYELELVAPGLRKSDFQLKIDGDTLTISFGQQDDEPTETAHAESKSAQKKDNLQTRWVRREFARQTFQRNFELGNTVDRDKISARYDSGVLHLTLPKRENLRPISRQIDIH
jgi:HSP20 family protein